MTQDEIIRSPIGREQLVTLAREAGAELYAETLCVNGKDAHDFIERFAALVAAHEREKQAKQEPVAIVDEIGLCLDGRPIFNAVGKVKVGQKLYAAPQPVQQEPDDLDWITPEAVFEAKLKLHGIPNPPVQQVDLTDEENGEWERLHGYID